MKPVNIDHVLTGCTGFVGSHLLANLLSDPSARRVSTLARGRRNCAPRERVLKALEVAGHIGTRDFTVVQGDLRADSCDMDLSMFPTLRRGETPLVFWHVAASLQWARGQREQVFETNVEGTQRALDLARSLEADLFVYFSTSYTCGSLEGLIPETLHRPPRFHNVYEESKNAAEQRVAQAAEEGFNTIILRPSIIVGSSKTFAACGSYTGLYGFLTELQRFKSMLGPARDTVRMVADRDAVLSFIPIDHVIEDTRAVVEARLAGAQDPICHITGTAGPRLGDLVDYALQRMELSERITMVSEEPGEQTPLERFFSRRMEFFSGYIKSTKRFVRSLEPVRELSYEDLTRFIDSEVEGARNER